MITEGWQQRVTEEEEEEECYLTCLGDVAPKRWLMFSTVSPKSMLTLAAPYYSEKSGSKFVLIYSLKISGTGFTSDKTGTQLHIFTPDTAVVSLSERELLGKTVARRLCLARLQFWSMTLKSY